LRSDPRRRPPHRLGQRRHGQTPARGGARYAAGNGRQGANRLGAAPLNQRARGFGGATDQSAGDRARKTARGAAHQRADQGPGGHAGENRKRFIHVFFGEEVGHVFEGFHLIKALGRVLSQHGYDLLQETGHRAG